MDLKDKLRRLSSPRVATETVVAAPEAKLAVDGDPRITALRGRLRELAHEHARKAAAAPPRTSKPLAQGSLPAQRKETAHGVVHLAEHRYAPEHRHGSAPLIDCLRALPADVAKLALDPRLADLDPSRLLFFDLETTGLAGGAGTLPFLVGLAFFEGESLRVEQLVLPAPGEELPMLSYLAERLRWASALVTYNGKTFDWPLVRTRCVINRVPVPELERHVDLLHLARRVFKHRLLEMRLSHLEREVLGFERQDDIAGADIPASYFAYLRGAPGSVLAPVLEHNVHDLVALAAVFGRLATQFQAAPDDDDPRDRLGFAQVAARAGDEARAYDFAQLVAQSSGRLSAEGLGLAARMAQAKGEYAHAAELLEQALVEARPHGELAAALHLRLSKLYEHRLRDYLRAVEHARATEMAEGGEAQEARLSRLAKRLARA